MPGWHDLFREVVCHLVFLHLLSKHESIEPDSKISLVQYHISGLDTTWQKHSSVFSIYRACTAALSCEIGS